MLDFATRALVYAGLVAEGICVASLVFTGKAKQLPLVFSFLAYLFISDAALLFVVPKSQSWPALVITTYIGYFLEVAAIWELASIAALTSRWEATSKRLRVGSLWLAFLVLGTLLLANTNGYRNFGVEEGTFLRVDVSASIFRVLAFITILWFRRRGNRASYVLAIQATLVFAAYAICSLMMHVFNQLDRWYVFPHDAFQISECSCGYVWIILLSVLTWQILRQSAVRPSPQLEPASKSAN